MFFLLSKLLLFIITPLVWIVALMLYAFFSKDERRKRKAFKISLILLLFFSNSFIVDEVVRAWEIPATTDKQVEGKLFEGAILLGGMTSYDSKLERIQFNQGSDRVMQALDLYKRGIVKKIIITGGSGSILHEEIKEAPLLKEFLMNLGIPSGDVLIEGDSKNTHENALFTKKLVETDSIKGKFLLITSAFHMRRAIGCFKKQGVEVESYSTDRMSGPRKFEFDHLVVPSLGALDLWTTMIHEMVGAMVYKLVGYS